MSGELVVLCTCSAQLQPHDPLPDVCDGSWAIIEPGEDVFVPDESDDTEVIIRA